MVQLHKHSNLWSAKCIKIGSLHTRKFASCALLESADTIPFFRCMPVTICHMLESPLSALQTWKFASPFVSLASVQFWKLLLLPLHINAQCTQAVSGIPVWILISTVGLHCCWTAVSPVANTAKLCNTAGEGGKSPWMQCQSDTTGKGWFYKKSLSYYGHNSVVNFKPQHVGNDLLYSVPRVIHLIIHHFSYCKVTPQLPKQLRPAASPRTGWWLLAEDYTVYSIPATAESAARHCMILARMRLLFGELTGRLQHGVCSGGAGDNCRLFSLCF